jgi:hypothetical protein
MRDDLLSTDEAAAHCHLAASTLEKLRVKGGGPPYYKLGKRVLYSRPDLDTWIAARRRLSTSNSGQDEHCRPPSGARRRASRRRPRAPGAAATRLRK